MSFRLGTWNIHLGIELDRILAAVAVGDHFRNLDVLLLQEVSVRAGQHDADAIAAALGAGYRAYQHNVDSLHGRVRGLAIVWNSATFEPRTTRMLTLPHLHNAALKGRHRYWLHPLRLRPRSTLIVEGRVRGRLARLHNLHLSPVGFNFQVEQLATILRDAAHQEPSDILALAGDFNTLRLDSRKWARWFAARAAEGWLDASGDVPWTFRSAALPMRQKLDHVLIRGPAAMRCQCRSPEVLASDHEPLLVELAWPTP